MGNDKTMESNAISPSSEVWKDRLRELKKAMAEAEKAMAEAEKAEAETAKAEAENGEEETFELSPDDLIEFLKNDSRTLRRSRHIKIDDYTREDGLDQNNNIKALKIMLKKAPFDKIDKYIITSTPTRIIISK
jgi:hypothetical protein